MFTILIYKVEIPNDRESEITISLKVSFAIFPIFPCDVGFLLHLSCGQELQRKSSILFYNLFFSNL